MSGYTQQQHASGCVFFYLHSVLCTLGHQSLYNSDTGILQNFDYYTIICIGIYGKRYILT